MLKVKFYTFGPNANNHVVWDFEVAYFDFTRTSGYFDGGVLWVLADKLQVDTEGDDGLIVQP